MGLAQVDAGRVRSRLKPVTELKFPGSSGRDDSHWKVCASNFSPKPCYEWYAELVERLASGLGKGEHLPLYRVSDGEFRFVLGPVTQRRLPWQLAAPQVAARFRERMHGTVRGHRSGATYYGYEECSAEEWAALREKYPEQLRRVAEEGVLAILLHETKTVEQYVAESLDWFDEHRLPVTPSNNNHVYSLYALLHGPDRHRLLRGRQVLVVTSLNPVNISGIAAGLRRKGVARVQFLGMSQSKALMAVLDLRAVKRLVDLVLIGAGIGSVNVLDQVRPLGAVAMDVGFRLSTLANPELRFERGYCVPDDECEPLKIKFESRASPWRLVKMRARRIVGEARRRGEEAGRRSLGGRAGIVVKAAKARRSR